MSTVFQMDLRIKVPRKSRDDAVSLLRPFIESTRVLPQCISSVLRSDPEDRRSLWLVEEWVSEESLMRHLKSEAFRIVISAMELSQEAPEIRFRSCHDLGGIEIIEKARLSESRGH